MATSSLFISYGHKDMEPVNWVEKLKMYLAPLRRKDLVDIWDDSRIGPGHEWRVEIARALDQASASILLVGPAFLDSEFIATDELPKLLAARRTRGAKIYPLVIAYCGYKQSALEPYQAFNDPDNPLEALQPPEQNKILNEISLMVDRDLRHRAASGTPPTAGGMREALAKIGEELSKTGTTFAAQCRRRDKLEALIRNRLKVTDRLQYEEFFFRHYGELNEEEKFQFEQIRAMTEGLLRDGNEAILKSIEANPQVLEEIPSLEDLRQHIVFWLNKYEKLFVKRPEMCLLYTGVEDGVPFPDRAEQDVRKWLAKHK
jgi:hypothetical protein